MISKCSSTLVTFAHSWPPMRTLRLAPSVPKLLPTIVKVTGPADGGTDAGLTVLILGAL